jgi:hypothetical protein
VVDVTAADELVAAGIGQRPSWLPDAQVGAVGVGGTDHHLVRTHDDPVNGARWR